MITAVGMMVGTAVFGSDAWGPWQILALVGSDIIAYAFASR